MTVGELRSILYELKETDEVALCNANAPIAAALPVADATVVTSGLVKEDRTSKLVLMFDTRKEGKE